jgi:hypothetical protein
MSRLRVVCRKCFASSVGKVEVWAEVSVTYSISELQPAVPRE